MSKITRNIVGEIRIQLQKYPIVAITGPRQSGKTTMLRNQLNDYRYVNLELPDNRKFAMEDPRGFMEIYDNKVILDEAQNVPELFSYLQGIVDESGTMGQFILSGSQNFNLMERISQSLAGRVAIFHLFPYDFREMQENDFANKPLSKIMTDGFYPAIFDRKIDADRYYSDYILTYLKRDIQQLVNVRNERKFMNFLGLCAARSGQLLNYNNLARDANISHTTVQNWLAHLETSFVIFQLAPYYKNYNKRIMKSPKLYFYDTGLLCHLLGIRNGEFDNRDKMWGNVFENLIVAEKIKQNQHDSTFKEFYFWRNSNGVEVDLLSPTKNGLETTEIKSSSTISAKMFKGLDYLEAISNNEVEKKEVIYGGDENQKRTEYMIQSWRNI